jgi:hypothetical protein
VSNGSLFRILLDKDLGEAKNDVFYIISLIRQYPMGKIRKITIKVAGSLTEIRTWNLDNKILEQYCYICLLGEVREKGI